MSFFFAFFYTQLSVYNLPSRTLLYSNQKNWNGSVRQYPANARSATISMAADLTAHHKPKWWYVHIMRLMFIISRTPSSTSWPCSPKHLWVLQLSWWDNLLSRVSGALCILPALSQLACDIQPYAQDLTCLLLQGSYQHRPSYPIISEKSDFHAQSATQNLIQKS